jgi:hypothetical protein
MYYIQACTFLFLVPRTQGRTLWVSPSGDDVSGSGLLSSPVKSPMRALQMAYPGDAIFLTTGVYAGELRMLKVKL